VTDRKLTRIPIRQVVRYHVLEVDGQKLEMARIGTTLASDLSQGGMFLSHTRLTPGVHVHFYFELPGGYIEAVGKVVHTQHRVDAVGVARPGSGVRFIRMSESDRQRLDAYLAGDAGTHRNSEARV
jgi:c-di-GMP-binding flagellar brake protein YcgR